MLLFAAGNRPSCRCAVQELAQMGVPVCDHVSPEITHLLLDIPSRKDTGDLLAMLPEKITIIGGNLDHLPTYRRLDLLKDEVFLAQNAAITADCAIKVAREQMCKAWFDTKVTILGWGRMAKSLAQMLKALGAEVTVLTRREKDRAILATLGYGTAETTADVVFNTVPAPVYCEGSLKIDLASVQGLTGEGVIWARGLPGIHAPCTTGKCIARRIWKEVQG